MRNILLAFIALLVMVSFFFGCSKTKTYAEKMKAEKKAIERFMDRNGYVVIGNYPDDGVFKPNEFYRTSEGLYMNVIDSQYNPGINKGDTFAVGNVVTVRFKVMQSFMTDTTRYTNWESYVPEEFVYGRINTQKVPEGWGFPLRYVKNYALVKLIIPSVIGTTANKNAVTPVFYDSLWYKIAL